MKCIKIYGIIVIIVLAQILNASATLPLTKTNETKESKTSKLKESDKPNNEPKPITKVEGKKLNIPSTPKVGQPKKLAVEPKLPVQPKSSEPKTIKSSIGLRASQANNAGKDTNTQKPENNAKARLENAIAQRKINSKPNPKPEHLLRESKVVEMIDKKLSPIMNMLTQISKDVSKSAQMQKTPTPNSRKPNIVQPNAMMTRQFQPDSLERAETIHRGVKHIKNFMNILEEVDSFLSSKARSALKQLAYVYEGDRGLKKPGKLTLKDKLHRLKGTLL